MSLLSKLISIVMNIDTELAWLIAKFGAFSYLIVFIIIFMETALVFTPFLPGDSLLFAVGAFAAIGSFNIFIVFFLLCLAAILGDSVNYSIGRFFGKRIIHMKSRFFNKEYVGRTQKFFDKYGSKTIVIARFIPIVRTFAPFLAGFGDMNYWKFLIYNIVGGIAWVSFFLFLGFFFGNIPFIKDNFSYVIIGIIMMSFIPVIYEFIKHRIRHHIDKRNKNKQQ